MGPVPEGPVVGAQSTQDTSGSVPQPHAFLEAPEAEVVSWASSSSLSQFRGGSVPWALCYK